MTTNIPPQFRTTGDLFDELVELINDTPTLITDDDEWGDFSDDHDRIKEIATELRSRQREGRL